MRTKIAIALPTVAIRRPMFVSLNSLTIDDLGLVRSVLNWLVIGATIVVWLGVFLEGERFSSAVKKQGWGLLVLGLGGETLFGIALLQVDAQISRMQKAENAVLQENVEILRAKNLKQAEKIVEMETALNQQGTTLGSVVTKIADREIREDDRKLIKQRLTGNQRRLTIVLLSEREPRLYGTKIAGALQAADFDVLIDNWRGVTPPNTGVVFCEIRKGDRLIFDVLHRAHVATQFISLEDHRPEFCDIPGVGAQLRNLLRA